MVRLLGVIVVLILVTVGVFAFNSNNIKFFSPSRAPCTDSDGGINLTLVGTTCDPQGCAQDYCNGDSKLEEYSCYKNKKISNGYSCEFGCFNGKCGVEGPRFNLHTASNKIYLTDSINKARQALTDTNLHSLLYDGYFNWSIESRSTNIFRIGSSQIIFAKQPTNNSDPKIGISLDTSGNYLYNLTVTFSNNIDFTNINSTNKNFSLLKRTFAVDNETNATRLVLRADKKYILENNLPVKFKSAINLSNGTNYFVETPIPGTLINWRNGVQDMFQISYVVYAPSDSEDAILEGGYFIDPFFRTFKIDLDPTSVPENSWQRENISVSYSGIDKMTISLKDHRNLEQKINWLLSDGFGNSALADSNGNKINTIEMARVNISHYTVIGDGNKGYIIKVLNITKNSNGYKDDVILVQDVFSGEINRLKIDSDGKGLLTIENSTYSVSYTDYDIKVEYPSSLQRDVVIYPPVKTSFGARASFYEPLTISLNSYLPNSSISSFNIFNGNSYVSIPVILSGTGFNIGGQNVDSNSSAIVNSGKLNYEFTYVSPFTTKVFLRDISRNKIQKPAIIIFESGGDALIVKTEGMGSSVNGVGIEDIEMNWGNNTMFKNLQLTSNPSIYKSMDIWGTITAVNKSNSDQHSANIKYNYQQLWNSVYISEIV